jgi:hypothetical protein
MGEARAYIGDFLGQIIIEEIQVNKESIGINNESCIKEYLLVIAERKEGGEIMRAGRLSGEEVLAEL